MFVEGEQSDRVLVILDGRVKVSLMTIDGKEVELAVRGPGDLIGELAFIDGERRSASATAVEPVSSLVPPRGATDAANASARDLRERQGDSCCATGGRPS
jgi:CRP-like cAMP-binding protein